MSTKKKISPYDCIFAIFSFIPILGVLFGTILIAIGFAKKSLLLKILGLSGILFNVILPASLFYFGFRSDDAHEAWNVFTVSNLNKSHIYLEYHKIQNDTYPDSLNYLKNYDSFITFNDSPNDNTLYYQKLSDSTYYLFGRGKDGKPFTKDDIYPTILTDSLKQNGLVKHKFSK